MLFAWKGMLKDYNFFVGWSIFHQYSTLCDLANEIIVFEFRLRTWTITNGGDLSVPHISSYIIINEFIVFMKSLEWYIYLNDALLGRNLYEWLDSACQTYTPALLKVRMEESKDANITHLKLRISCNKKDMNFLSSIAK